MVMNLAQTKDSNGRAVALIASFTPPDIAGNTLWLRADLGITLNGGVVETWSDQSGAGNHVTQGTAANRPAYSAAGGANGRAMLSFDGTNDALVKASFTAALHYTAFAVFRSTGGAFPQGAFNCDATPRVFQLRYGSAVLAEAIAFDSGGSAFTDNQAATASDWNVVEMVRDATTVQVFVNGTSGGSTGTTGTPASGTPNLVVGAAAGLSDVLTGDLSECIYYNTALSSSQRSQVRRYLGTRYGITVS